jgi:hypothetical protein
MIAVAQTLSMLVLTGVILSTSLASVIALLSLGRDWSAWQHPRRHELMPMADSAAAWFAITVFVPPLGLVAYLMDRRHAPLKG